MRRQGIAFSIVLACLFALGPARSATCFTRAGLLDSPLDSTGFMKFGEGGGGQWVSFYANHGHVFAVIAGLRWDTSLITDGDRTGPGWSDVMRPDTKHFKVRHPLGVLGATPLVSPNP